MSGYGIDRRRWNQLSLYQRMGNIGSEVGRSLVAKRTGDANRLDNALARALDLFDATVTGLAPERPAQAREVLRAKEEYLALVAADHLDDGEAASLERYFDQFALAARLSRS